MVIYIKILHLNNIAGIPVELSKELRLSGHQSDVIVFREYPTIPNTHDFNLNTDRYHKLFQPFYRLYRLLKDFRDYDVYHMHSASFVTFYIDAPILKLLGKKVVYTHWGSDVRNKKISWYSLSRFADLRYVGTLDLFNWVPKNTFWLPIPVDIEYWSPVSAIFNANKTTILHAPSNRAIKGTDDVLKIVKELQDEGEQIELLLVENISHDKVKELYANADIVVDQLVTGFYGTFACEMMSMEKPVLCYVNQAYLNRALISDCPIINTTALTLKQHLKELIHDKNKQRELGKKGRLYVEKYHDIKKITANLLHDYKELFKEVEVYD